MKTYTLTCEYGCTNDTDILRVLKDAKSVSAELGCECWVNEKSTGELRAVYNNGEKVYFA